jgi:hypothetical protein
MKKIISVCFIVLLSFLSNYVSGQELIFPESCLNIDNAIFYNIVAKDSALIRRNKIKTISVGDYKYFYRKDGLLAKIEKNHIERIIDTLIYNDKANAVSVLSLNQNRDTIENYKFKFNDVGNLIEKTKISYEGDYHEKWVYLYNKRGYVKISNKYINDTLHISLSHEYTFSNENTLIQSKTYKSGVLNKLIYFNMGEELSRYEYNEEGMPIYVIQYIYNRDGKIISKSEWNNDELNYYTAEYNKQGFLIKEKLCLELNKEQIVEKKYHYNDLGLLDYYELLNLGQLNNNMRINIKYHFYEIFDVE